MARQTPFKWLANTESPDAASELESILAISNDAIFTKDLDSVITSWSAGAARLYGYSPAETIGRHVSMLVPPERGGDSLAQTGPG